VFYRAEAGKRARLGNRTDVVAESAYIVRTHQSALSPVTAWPCFCACYFAVPRIQMSHGTSVSLEARLVGVEHAESDHGACLDRKSKRGLKPNGWPRFVSLALEYK